MCVHGHPPRLGETRVSSFLRTAASPYRAPRGRPSDQFGLPPAWTLRGQLRQAGLGRQGRRSRRCAVSTASRRKTSAQGNSPVCVSACARSGMSSTRAAVVLGVQVVRPPEQVRGRRHVLALERAASGRVELDRGTVCQSRWWSSGSRARPGTHGPARGGSRESPRTRCRAALGVHAFAQSANCSCRPARRRFSRPAYAASRIRMWSKRNPIARRTSASGGRAALHERFQPLLDLGADSVGDERLDRVARELEADDGRNVHDRAFVDAETVEPRRQERVNRRRDRESSE